MFQKIFKKYSTKYDSWEKVKMILGLGHLKNDYNDIIEKIYLHLFLSKNNV
jgi:hypothetical protein